MVKGITRQVLSQECWWPPGYSPKHHKIVIADLNRLTDSIVDVVDQVNKRIISLKPTFIKDTPHYQYALGNKSPYEDYLNKCKHITWAREAIGEQHLEMQFMFDKFDKILNSDDAYLDSPYEDRYIIVNGRGQIVDGLHRSVSLLINGIGKAPVALV
jgi:hypothetical protein